MSTYTTKHIHSVVSGGPHRAVVTYSDSQTGEIRVNVPALFSRYELTISFFGRSPSTSGEWSVPPVGGQILVGTDDQTFTNVFWIQSDGTSKLEEQIESLQTEITTTLEAQITALENQVTVLENRIAVLENVTSSLLLGVF